MLSQMQLAYYQSENVSLQSRRVGKDSQLYWWSPEKKLHTEATGGRNVSLIVNDLCKNASKKL